MFYLYCENSFGLKASLTSPNAERFSGILHCTSATLKKSLFHMYESLKVFWKSLNMFYILQYRSRCGHSMSSPSHLSLILCLLITQLWDISPGCMNKGKGKKMGEWWTLMTWNTLVNSSIFLIQEEMHNLGSGLAFPVVEPCSSFLGLVYDGKEWRFG